MRRFEPASRARKRSPASREPARPSAVSNHALSRRILARKVSWNGKQLVKQDRLPFDSDLEKAMPVKSGEHRAHVIAYDTLTKGVMDPINECLAKKNLDALPYAFNMITAIYPGGDKQLFRHPANGDLLKIAQKNRKRAELAYAEIEAILKGTSTASLEAWTNELIGALNNSPDNLRPGADRTNSSIQQGLDLQPTGVETLKKNTTIVDATKPFELAKWTQTALAADTVVLRVSVLDEWMVWQMLTTTWSNRNELYLYSSGAKLQSSDYADMTSKSMSKNNPTHLAIKVPGSGDFFLFAI